MSYAVRNLSPGGREMVALRIGDQEFCVARGILAIEKRMICLIELEVLFSDSESEAA